MIKDCIKTDYEHACLNEDTCIRFETNNTLRVELSYRSIHVFIVYYIL